MLNRPFQLCHDLGVVTGHLLHKYSKWSFDCQHIMVK